MNYVSITIPKKKRQIVSLGVMPPWETSLLACLR